MGFEMFKMVHMAEKSSYDSKWLCLVLTLSAMAPWDLIDIGQNVSNFAGLVWKADFQHFFGIFFKTDFCVKTVNTMNPII